MPAAFKKPVKITDRRRGKAPAKVQQQLFHTPGVATPARPSTDYSEFRTPGGTTFSDRRNPPPPGMPPYVRRGRGPTLGSGGAARSL